MRGTDGWSEQLLGSSVKFIRVHRKTNARIQMHIILLSGAKTWTHPPSGSLAHSTFSRSSLPTARSRQMRKPYLNLFSLPSHSLSSSKREVINHRAINNQYFSSNVYRVRFKCLVKTNLRPYEGGLDCALFAFSLCPPPLLLSSRCPSDEYISRPAPT